MFASFKGLHLATQRAYVQRGTERLVARPLLCVGIPIAYVSMNRNNNTILILFIYYNHRHNTTRESMLSQ